MFTVLVRKFANEVEFIEYWISLYVDKRSHLYKDNIGKPLTAARLEQLFEWKNGGTIAKLKLASIHRNYIKAVPVPPAVDDRDSHVDFITAPGGAIWRIFWLHCYNHTQYPIFDQHVYRAMKHMQTGELVELPSRTTDRAIAYYDEYLPFYRRFMYQDKKRVDEALWSYGKYLSQYPLPGT